MNKVKTKGKTMSKAKAKAEYSEISDIKDDLDSVLSNVVALTKHLTDDGKEKAAELTEALKEQTFRAAGRLAARGSELAAQGEDKLSDLTDHVKANPGKSVLFAFAGGILASVLFGRKN